ncbi:sulfotransferase [Echinicola marina]|uniref:sulfotransferase family protein n=1 Tax=Echinicola marina TaxID=2859768 RepID=UPI001CF6ECAF|nr:sulfotransferase [Echinicola marina]UCS95054.1 sulfotransferase [Echinicola marina]
MNMNRIGSILANKNLLPEDGLVIFGEARSGTTWLMELLSHIPNAIINWEPLHIEKGVVPKEFNWGDRPYIPSDDRYKEYGDLINDILSLRKYSEWTIGKNSWEGIVNGKVVLTKFVRANLLIPWICQNIKFRHKPILLLRHPIDTCFSQLKAFGRGTNDYGEIPSSIHNVRFLQKKEILKNAKNDLEYKIILWCINNMPLLANPGLKDLVEVIYYEDLIIDPRKQIRSILERVIPNENIAEVMSLIPFRAASETSLNGLDSSPLMQLYKNMDAIDYRQKERIQIIFDHFGLEMYNAFSPYRVSSKIKL